MAHENMITKIEICLDENDGFYRVHLTKRFSAEFGGGESTIQVGAYKNIHVALDAAKSGVTVTKSYREAFEATGI